MSKLLPLLALVALTVSAIVASAPEVAMAGATATLLLALWAYGRNFVAWVAAGTHYGA